MLEGLDVSVLRLSEVSEANPSFRIDSQYFGKVALKSELKIKTGKWSRLRDGCASLESFGAYALTNEFEYVPDGIPFLRCVNVKHGFVDFNNVLYVDEKANSLLSKSEVKPNMVLLTMSGSVGNSAVALDSWRYPINSNQDIAKITCNGDLDPYYLAAFLESSYGQVLMERLPVGSVQQHIFLWMIEGIVVPRFGMSLEAAISRTVRSAYEIEARSRFHQTEAERILLAYLALKDWQPSEPLTYSRRSLDVLAANRLDADHFKPKYDQMVARIRDRFDTVPLESLLVSNRRGKQPKYEPVGIPVVNSKHVLRNEVLVNDDNARASASDEGLDIGYGDVVINGTGVGTIGRAAPYLHTSPAVPDNHVTILRPRPGAVDAVYLSVYLNTVAGQWQVEKHLRGSSGQIELYPGDIAKFWIALAPAELQLQVRSTVLGAFAERAEAHAALQRAAQAVEIAIEHGEARALKALQ